MLKKCLSVILSMALILITIPAYAEYTNGYIKIGLFYNSSAKQTVEAEVLGGSIIGFESNYQFTDIVEYPSDNITVSKADGVYIKTGGGFDNPSDVLSYGQDILKLSLNQITIAYLDRSYHLLMGGFPSVEEAAAKAQEIYTNSGEPSEVIELKGGVTVTAMGLFSFAFKDDELNIGVRPILDNGHTKIGQRRYSGEILFKSSEQEDITVINLISVEKYLYSVVGSEMYTTWHIEALKAQAVVARTYAAAYGSGFSKYGFDLDDTTLTQVYKGLESVTDSTVEAVNATAGEIIAYEGTPISALFGSSSGGRTADSRSAWGSKIYIPYLRSIEDPYENPDEAKSVWQVVLTPSQVREKLLARGIDIGEVTGIYVLERGEGDERVTKLKITGTLGEKVLTYEACRTYLGLKSQYYYVNRSDGSEAAGFVLTAGGIKKTSVSGTMALGTSSLIMPLRVYLTGANSTAVLTSTESGNFIFSGRGYGHGVGMSQYGAKGMAELGFSYKDIIAHYYPGTEIIKK